MGDDPNTVDGGPSLYFIRRVLDEYEMDRYSLLATLAQSGIMSFSNYKDLERLNAKIDEAWAKLATDR